MTGLTKLYFIVGGILVASSLFGQERTDRVKRLYSVEEIDELRLACNDRYVFGTTYFVFDSTGVITGRQVKEIERVKAVEEMIRTYLLAGITAKQIREEDKRLAKERIVFFNASGDTLFVVPSWKKEKR